MICELPLNCGNQFRGSIEEAVFRFQPGSQVWMYGAVAIRTTDFCMRNSNQFQSVPKTFRTVVLGEKGPDWDQRFL